MVTQHEMGKPEHALGMSRIASRIEALTGHRPSRSALWRWHLKGRLASRRIGGRLYTTEAAIRAMLAADEQRNRGSIESRGEAAAARVRCMLDERPERGEVA
jgi:hypothetical protein